MISTPRRIAVTALLLGVCIAASLFVHSSWLAALLATHHLHVPDTLEHLFWDTEPYGRGIGKVMAGHTPYDDPMESLLPFVYPPAFAWVGAALGRLLPFPYGYSLYIFAYLISMIGTQLLLVPFFVRHLDRVRGLTLLILAPLSLFSSTMFWSGNIHVIWLFVAALSAAPGLEREQWWPYRIVALLAMVNQPIFASLMLLPVFAGRREWIASIATAVVAGVLYFSQSLIDPALYHQFQSSIAPRLAITHDYGQGIFGILMWFGDRFAHVQPLLAAGVVQVAASLAVVGCLFLLRPHVSRGDPRWWALLAVAIVAVNPRIMPYDVIAVIGPALSLIFALRPTRQWAVMLIVTLVGFAFHKAIGLTPLLFASFAAGVWQLWSERTDDTAMLAIA